MIEVKNLEKSFGEQKVLMMFRLFAQMVKLQEL